MYDPKDALYILGESVATDSEIPDEEAQQAFDNVLDYVYDLEGRIREALLACKREGVDRFSIAAILRGESAKQDGTA
jgi:hypothetical protein